MLNLLKKQGAASFANLQKDLNISKDSILWAMANLSKAGLINVDKESTNTASLTKEARGYLAKFPEETLVSELYGHGAGMPLSRIENKIGIIWAKRNGWIAISEGRANLTGKGRSIAEGKTNYATRELLGKLNDPEQTDTDALIKENEKIISDLKSRNLIEITERGVIESVKLTKKGKASAASEEKGIGPLTRDIIASGKWKSEGLKKYDIHADSERIYPARLHPMHELLDTIRSAYFNLGFTEVSGPIIESAFWNFDALFVPQDHPAREMQDTFFLSNPKKITIEDVELMNKLKKVHKKNWKDVWKESVARQALLRTHTTSVSSRYIRKFADSMENNYPIKLFSVGRVFRNESIDYKHLAEFYQMDGIIIGNNLTFSNLIDTLSKLYSQLGLEVKFKPAYFPFVEPGMEIYYYDEKKKDTIELGGAGIIRKEITKAMGTNKTVLAWGPGVDRLIFNLMEIDSLIHLYKNNVGWLRNRPELKL